MKLRNKMKFGNLISRKDVENFERLWREKEMRRR